MWPDTLTTVVYELEILCRCQINRELAWHDLLYHFSYFIKGSELKYERAIRQVIPKY